MKFSIITITFNSEATLEETIRSVLAQTHKDIEYIIVDGRSTDKTLRIIDKYRNRIAQVVSEPDKGLYDALNKGIALSTGDVIGILHSDDIYIHNDVVARYNETFLNSSADAVYADLYYVDRTNTDRVVRKWKSGTYRSSSFYYGWMPPHPTFMAKRDVYATYGNFDPAFGTAADYELMLRFILRHGISIAYLQEFVIKMRVGGASNVTLASRIAANLEDRKAWKKNGLRPGPLTLFLKPLRKLVQFI